MVSFGQVFSYPAVYPKFCRGNDPRQPYSQSDPVGQNCGALEGLQIICRLSHKLGKAGRVFKNVSDVLDVCA